MLKRYTLYHVLIIATLVAACGAKVPVQALLFTGDVLDAAGAQFLATGKLYDQLFLAKKVTVGEYRAWAKFSEDFKVGYRQAVEAWNAGTTGGPKAEQFLMIKDALRDHFIIANQRNR